MEHKDPVVKTEPLELKIEFEDAGEPPQSWHMAEKNQCVSSREDACTENTTGNQTGLYSEIRNVHGTSNIRTGSFLPDCKREPSDQCKDNNGFMEQEDTEDSLSDSDDHTDEIPRKTKRVNPKTGPIGVQKRRATSIVQIKTEPGLIMECEEQSTFSAYNGKNGKSESSGLSEDSDSSESDLEESEEICDSGNFKSESSAFSMPFITTQLTDKRMQIVPVVPGAVSTAADFTVSESSGVGKNKKAKKAKSHSCEQCDATFPKSSQLKKHMKMHAESKTYSCELCDAKFLCPKYLKSHMMIHKGHKPYACQYCDAKFARSNHLKSHTLMHTGEKPHVCNLCDAKFTRASNLRNHMLVHEGQKPHVCPQCDAKFTDRRTLKRHILIHTGLKPHVCQQCGARFTLPGNLRQHELTHTGLKSHACDQCEARFTRSFALKKHLLIHTGVNPHTCEQCDAKFASPAYLKKHMSRCNAAALKKDPEISFNWHLYKGPVSGR